MPRNHVKESWIDNIEAFAVGAIVGCVLMRAYIKQIKRHTALSDIH